MLKHATMVAQDLTRARITIDHISGYLEDSPPVEDSEDMRDEWDSAFHKKRPVIRKGRLCIHSTLLRQWASSMRLPPEDVSDSSLGNVGFKSSQITARVQGRPVGRHYWQIESVRWAAQLDSPVLEPEIL